MRALLNRRAVVAFVAALAGVAGAARAAPTHAVASLLAPTSAVVPGHDLTLGLRLQLAPGWHTYWQNPGDAGLAPAVTVGLDGGAPRAAALRFPTPSRIDEGGLTGFGYTGAVLLPFTVAVPPGPAAGTLAIAVGADYLVCAAVCVPQHADLVLDLPRAASSAAIPPSAAAPLFTASAAAMPRPAPFHATVARNGTLMVRSDLIGPVSVRNALFFPDRPGLTDPDAPAPVTVAPGRLTVALRAGPAYAAAATLDGVLVLTDGTGARTPFRIAARRRTASDPAPGDAPPAAAAPSLALLLLFALTGGLLLNGMPCVFPVLALKALALVRAAAGDRSRLRRHALGYSAGAVGAFVALGATLLLLRLAGADIGWGFQFQSPPFVALTALMFGAVALNLAGVFTVALPVGRVGQRAMGRVGWIGDLATGALAVLVATPCTAPFMGVALAGALAGPPLAALGVFASLGVGLALPIGALAVLPALARLVPRPGRWTVLLQRLLAIPMAAATVWLVAVLGHETGPAGVVRMAVCLALLGAAAAALRFRRTPAAILLVAALALVPGLRSAAPTSGEGGLGPAGAERFTPTRLAALRAAGRPVLVEMSAAWCLTCLVNERVALAVAPVRAALRAHDAVLLRGDWTAGDPAITDFLRRFDRDGVPLAVWFPPGGGAPEVLPALLTAGDVLRRLDATG